MELITHAIDQRAERRFVAVHRPLDEYPLHPSPLGHPPDGRFAEYESRAARIIQMTWRSAAGSPLGS
jgi:hypothetical protein